MHAVHYLSCAFSTDTVCVSGRSYYFQLVKVFFILNGLVATFYSALGSF